MKIIGHRGAKGLAPENTLQSIKKALEHHVDMIEVDVRVTKDNIPILHHDPQLVDASGSRLLVAEHTYKQLLAHKSDLATLDAAIMTVDRAAILYIEVKPGEPAQSVIRILRAYLAKGWQPADFRFLSHDMAILRALHTAFPDIIVTVLERWSGVRACRRANELKTTHLMMYYRWLWPGFIRAVTRSGYKLGAYPLNDPAKAKRWERAGLRAVVTDYPDRFESRHSKLDLESNKK